MDKISKVRQYLKISGHTEEKIDKIVSNQQYVEMIYRIISTCEDSISRLGISTDQIDNCANNRMKIK